MQTRGGRQGVHLADGEPVLRVGRLVISGGDVVRLRGQGGGPALQRVGQADPADLDVGPVAHGDDLVRDAGRREDGRDVVEGFAEAAPALVDVVPLVAGRRKGHVVRVHLEGVELPLDDEERA